MGLFDLKWVTLAPKLPFISLYKSQLERLRATYGLAHDEFAGMVFASPVGVHAAYEQNVEMARQRDPNAAEERDHWRIAHTMMISAREGVLFTDQNHFQNPP